MKCIYCLEDKPTFSYTKTEHVIPQSFGKFKNNFTLNNIVCDDCNQYFGDNLDIALSRDTFEGTYRYECEIKKSNQFKSLGRKSRIKIKVENGKVKGTYAYREFSKEENKILLKPLPQIGFLKLDSSEYDYFLLNEIPDKKVLEGEGFNLSHPESIRIFGCDLETAKRKLYEKGIKLKFGGVIEPEKDSNKSFFCKFKGILDSFIFRALAKIGFNYLAYWEGSNFVFQDEFNTIRRYIRYGDETNYTLIRPIDKNILGDEPIDGSKRLGHIITLNWTVDKVSIGCQIS